MERRGFSRVRVGVVAGTAVLAVVLQSLPTQATQGVQAAPGVQALPPGAADKAPGQRTGSADDPPSVTGSPVGRAAGPSPAARPPGAVPETRAPRPVVRREPARQRLSKVPLTSVPSRDTFDARTAREVKRSDWTADTRVYEDADGTTVRRMYPGPVNVQQSDGQWMPMAATTHNAELDDTYVTTGSTADRSGEPRLQIGNRAGRTSAAFLHFPGLTSGAMRNQYISGLTLNLHTIETPSCTPKPVDVFAVSRPWSGPDVRSWPGVAVGQQLGQLSFAFGLPSGCPTNWGRIPLAPDPATDWTHGATFNGLAVRAANEGDTGAWKSFASANTPEPEGKPYLDVKYAPHGASYHVDEVTLPTNTLTGQLKATVRNRGSVTWTPSGPHKFGVIIRGTSYVGKHAVPRDVAPGQTVQMVVSLPPLTPGVTYNVDLTMFNGTTDYQPAYDVPYGSFPLKIVNVPPSIAREQPGSGAAVDSIRPTLYAEGNDTDNWPGTGLKYNFKICLAPGTDQTTCQTSGWTGATWTPPKPLLWSKTYVWWVQAHDNVAAGPFVNPPLELTTQVPQPQITSHIGGTPSGAPAPGLDPQVGNFGLTSTDASVTTVGPDLTIARTYNSLDPRTDTAFGQGWASRLDTQLTEDLDGSGNVVVTLPTGRQVRFGRNADGTFAPPQGENLTLVKQTSTQYFVLRDGAGTRWDFNAYGRLRMITDAAGLAEEVEYDDAGPGGRPKSLYNLTSKRRLLLTWTGGHITAVRTETPALTWTYSYDGHRLTSACNPAEAPNCTTYEYQQGSHYRSVVMDDNPRGFWRFGETSAAGGATSIAARKADADKGIYTGVGLGAAGALAGTTDTAAFFGGSDAASRVVLPSKLVSPTMSVAVELWFKTTSGGVLMSYANKPFGTTPSRYAPILYVGQDGLLHGGFWVSKPADDRQIVAPNAVNDGQWHHVVLSGSVDRQELYLDGQRVGDTISGPIDHYSMENLVVGAGYTKGWPSGNDGTYHFTGHIDEVAVYQHPLGATAAAQHFAARQSVVQLTKVLQPQDGRVAAAIGYDVVNDRVATLTDHDGRAWRLDVPVRDEAVRKVTLRGPYPDWVYEFDADHGGRITSRTQDGRKREYKYNEAGFLSQEIDELRHAVTYTTDAHGNVLSQSTCRTQTSCQTSYSTYYLNAADPLDPRNGRKTSQSDARSSGPDDTTYRTTYSYDTAGRLTATKYPKTAAGQEPTETWTYSTGTEAAVGGGTTPAGLLIAHTGKRTGQTTRYLYRANGDLAEQVDPAGLRTQYEYDGIGRKTVEKVLAAAGAEFRRTTTTYTPRSEVAKVVGSPIRNAVTGVTGTPVTDFEYDANGNQVRVTQGSVEGTAPARVTEYEYDALDHLVLTRFPDGKEERREYLAGGREQRITDPAGTLWIEYYDAQARLLRRVASGPKVDPSDPAGTLLTLEVNNYDAAGRLISTRDAIGRETVRTYYDDDLPDTVSVAGVQQAKYVYDAAGNTVRETAAGGRVSSFEYDPAGYVTASTLDPTTLKRKTAYVRATDGLATREIRTGAAQPDRSESVDYGYDSAGRLVREAVALTPGDVMTADYDRDERGLVTAVTDRRRLTTNYQYDGNGQLIAETLPEVTTWVGTQQSVVRPQTSYGYNVFGELTQQRDPNQAVTVLDRDARGRATAVHRPTYTPPGGTAIAAVDRTEYDAVGNPVVLTDPLGRQTRRVYDPYGRPVEETKPKVGEQPSTTTLRYNRAGELVSQTDPTGATQQWTYDDFGRRITETAVDRRPQLAYYTTEYGYDDAGNLVTRKTPGGSLTQTEYNAAGEPVKVTDPTGKVTSATYDNVGRQLTVRDPAGIVTETGYDLLGRATWTRQLSGSPLTERRRWQQVYDANGNLIQQISPEGRTTTRAYDAVGRPVRQDEQVADGKLIRTTFGYDANGNKTRQVDGKQQVTRYGYTPWNQPETTVDAGNATWTAIYDAAGRQVRNNLPGGVVVSTEYDAQDRPVRQTGSGAEAPTADRAFGFDAAGRLTSFGGPSGDTTASYDDRGNLLTLNGPGGNATFTYTADSQVASRNDATGGSSFTYDAAGRPKVVADGLSGSTIDYGYDSAGRLSSSVEREQEGIVRRVVSYDPVGRLASDKVAEPDPMGGPDRIIQGTEYGYDRDDNLTAKTTITNNRRTANSYAYDGAGRLTSWTAPTGTTPYEWDDAGNRTKAGAKSFSYNAQNQLVSDGTTTYTYTARGTLKTAGDKTYSFDAFEQLASDGTPYSYDSLGRVARRGDATFAYAGLANAPVSDGTRLISRDGFGNPLSDKATGSTATAKLLYADQHGDITARFRGLDTYGTKTFDPFGTPLASSGEQAALGYQGEWTSPDGAVNMHSRWYQPSTATFTSRDTWANAPTPSTATNRYTYGNARPLTQADPTGHCNQTVVDAYNDFLDFVPWKLAKLAEIECMNVDRRLQGTNPRHFGNGPHFCDGCEMGNKPPSSLKPGNYRPYGGRDDDGPGWRIPVPPPPPPPLWVINLLKPPPRPGPGKTTQPRPPRVRADDRLTRTIDRSDHLAEAGNHTTLSEAGWATMLQLVVQGMGAPEPGEETGNDQDESWRNCFDGGPAGPPHGYWPTHPVAQGNGSVQVASGATTCLGPTSYLKGAQDDPRFKASYTPPGYVSKNKPMMARCHNIPAMFQGSGKDPRNIFPCYHRTTNVQYMRDRMETCVKNELLSGGSDIRLLYQVSLEYPPGETFPDVVHMTAVSNDGYLHAISIQNDANPNQAVPKCP